jgi:two-component sensor histidine kinase
MPLAAFFNHSSSFARRMSRTVQLSGTVACVGVAYGLRALLDPLWPAGFPFLVAVLGILASATLFGEGCGLLATGLSAAAAVYFYLPPYYSFAVSEPSHFTALVTFCVVGSLISLVISSLHRALAEVRAGEQVQASMLREFRHRTRNDLGNLSALLLLRAGRSAPECRAHLREAAGHAMSLARVHTRLGNAAAGAGHEVVVCSRDFVDGLAGDILLALSNGALNPIGLLSECEDHPIDTERAVVVGQILNECLSGALQHAFPNDREGRITVRFRREEPMFVLEVEDDGVSVEATTGDLGARIQGALAAQLRGTFVRQPLAAGGTLRRLTFPLVGPARLSLPAPAA